MHQTHKVAKSRQRASFIMRLWAQTISILPWAWPRALLIFTIIQWAAIEIRIFLLNIINRKYIPRVPPAQLGDWDYPMSWYDFQRYPESAGITASSARWSCQGHYDWYKAAPGGSMPPGSLSAASDYSKRKEKWGKSSRFCVHRIVTPRACV